MSNKIIELGNKSGEWLSVNKKDKSAKKPICPCLVDQKGEFPNHFIADLQSLVALSA